MTFLRFAIAAFFFGISTSAFAGENQPARVLELFTSQGCSSCPPANIFVGKMAEDRDTLVLSYGVTYWDYLGWKDTFASPVFTERQRAYGRALGNANVYTPQMVLNGSAHGSRYSKHDVQSMALPASQPRLRFGVEGGTLRSAFIAPQQKNYDAVLVEYVPGPQSVPVNRGENRGRVLTLTNVVTSLKPLGVWQDRKALDTRVRPQNGKAYALLLHDPRTKKVVGAVQYDGVPY